MTYARALTLEGIRRAQEFVRAVRNDPTLPLTPPNDILFGARCSREIERAPRVEHREFTTRREAAEYLASLSPAPDRRSVDDWSFWSWLGLYHLSDVLHTDERRDRMSSEEETFVVDVTDGRSRQSSTATTSGRRGGCTKCSAKRLRSSWIATLWRSAS